MKEVTVPRLGWSMEEGTFIAWLKKDGEPVRAGEPLFTLEGEKATQDIEATDSGILQIPADAPEPGSTVRVGAVLAFVLQEGETTPHPKPSPHQPSNPAPAIETRKEPSRSSNSHASPQLDSVEPAPRRIAISPRAMRKAAELGVDWRSLRGTGRAGRIRERDVLAALSEPTPTSTANIDSAPVIRLSGRLLPISPMRRVIARRMSDGVHQAAPVTLTTRADATRLMRQREAFKAAAVQSPKAAPTFTDMLAKLTASALQEHPMLNTQWRDDGIFIPDAINIALAVDTEDGLLAPVLRNVARLSLDQVAALSRSLIEQARARRLTPGQLQDGTFTITNLGSLGIDAFTPILNLPQCAVLGVGCIRREPVVVGDEVVIRQMVSLSLTFDHRIVDGAPAARFLQTLRAFIENEDDSAVALRFLSDELGQAQ